MSYSVTRNYSLGTADPRSFSRNKRGIAGSLIWVNFDRHALLDLVYKLGGQFVANVDDICWDPHRSERLCVPGRYPGQMLVRIAASPLPPPSISSPASPSPPSPARRKRPAPGTPKTHKKLFWTRCSLARADAAIAIAAEIFCRNALYAANDKGFVTFFRRRKLLGLRS